MNTKTVVFCSVLVLSIIAGMVHYAFLVNTQNVDESKVPLASTNRDLITDNPAEGISVTDNYTLPVSGSVATQSIKHTVPLTDIKRGCFRQDCIPSVENPEFVPAVELAGVLAADSLGIVIHSAKRFYPFPMLETHELVNETLPNGMPVLVSYCPLCGTGIVFNREIEGEVVEFGVSGMLWQSNLLMYNRADDIRDQNLWSQVLGQAVVGEGAGHKLEVVPSDIITFSDWLATNPQGETLVTGAPADPYDGAYVDVALRFGPDFDPATSIIPANTYVYGIVVDDQPKAYMAANLFNEMTDFVGDERIFVHISDTEAVEFFISNAENGQAPTVLSDIEGFWFSWAAAHPNTELWTGE